MFYVEHGTDRRRKHLGCLTLEMFCPPGSGFEVASFKVRPAYL